MKHKFSKEVLEMAAKVTAKRPRAVIDYILEHGQVTTEQLGELGYNHPPRAARDVREQGVPLVTIRVKSSDGRAIGAYTFGDPKDIKAGRIGGRKAFSKEFKAKLIDELGQRCTITGEVLEDRYLQIDHRIPYEVAGDDADNFQDTNAYMLLDASAQRAKSFSCENCQNFTTDLNQEKCKSCFWASPESYTHVALTPKRIMYVTWQGDNEVENFGKLIKEAAANGMTPQEYVKKKLSND